MKVILNIALMASVLVSAACDKTKTKIQYMPDMADGPTVKAQESFLNPPEHSVAMNAILYPEKIEEAEQLLRNPHPNSEEVIAKGKVLYDTFCIPCHGATGKRDGSISDKFPGMPDITEKLFADRQDGFYFYRITFGMGRMPGYGHAISPAERWYIIHYLRTLQKAG
jgi:mono/diheme cytochrome c family protein